MCAHSVRAVADELGPWSIWPTFCASGLLLVHCCWLGIRVKHSIKALLVSLVLWVHLRSRTRLGAHTQAQYAAYGLSKSLKPVLYERYEVWSCTGGRLAWSGVCK